MTSKWELEAKLQVARDFRRDALEGERKAQERARRLETALERVAKHYGFHDAYVREKLREIQGAGWELRPAIIHVNEFSADDLIADLDTIDQARSADEARARLGIKEEA